MKNFLEPIVGFISGTISWAIWDDVLVTLIVAFLSAIAAFLGKELAVWTKRKIIQKRQANED